MARSLKTEAVVLRSMRLGEADRVLHLYTLELRRSHRVAREQPYRLAVGLIGAEAMLRLFAEPEPNARAFTALTRFLELLDAREPRAGAAAVDPLALAFQ